MWLNTSLGLWALLIGGVLAQYDQHNGKDGVDFGGIAEGDVTRSSGEGSGNANIIICYNYYLILMMRGILHNQVAKIIPDGNWSTEPVQPDHRVEATRRNRMAAPELQQQQQRRQKPRMWQYQHRVQHVHLRSRFQSR